MLTAVNDLKKLELLLGCLSEYFTANQNNSLADAVVGVKEINTRKNPQPVWGENSRSTEALVVASVVAEELQGSPTFPVAFTWAKFIVDALSLKETDNESNEKWGPTKTVQGLSEIRHFIGLLEV